MKNFSIGEFSFTVRKIIDICKSFNDSKNFPMWKYKSVK